MEILISACSCSATCFPKRTSTTSSAFCRGRFLHLLPLWDSSPLTQATPRPPRCCSNTSPHPKPERSGKKQGTSRIAERGILVKPASYVASQKYPTILYIHRGPNGQDSHSFSFERQFIAANGYVVISVNYRGSAGRGSAYQKAIYADWGNKEVVDLLGAVDHMIATGIADPNRLGIGGWSYGGILTDYTIATDSRFKAAISGAGSALQTSMYGLDQYTRQYDNEIGPPWKAQDVWIKISYPFFHADRIKTPTLFLGGEKDFNVPVAGGEQMYQVLRSLGVDTQLIIYPGQNHTLTTPSYQRDRLERYAEWFNKYLKASSN